MKIKELPNLVGDVNVAKFGQGSAFKNKWIKKDGDSLRPAVDDIEDVIGKQLKEIQETKEKRPAWLHDRRTVEPLAWIDGDTHRGGNSSSGEACAGGRGGRHNPAAGKHAAAARERKGSHAAE